MESKKFLTMEEFMKVTGISRSLGYDLVAKKKIPSVKFGKAIRIPAAYLHELEEDLLRNTHTSKSAQK
jgi:excisionase family DNA binding protein